MKPKHTKRLARAQNIRTPQPESAPMTPERKALADAIAFHDAALQKVEQSEATLQKAHNLRCSLYADLAELSTLDAEISAARANNLATALAAGEAPLFDEPQGFARDTLRKEKVERELAITTASIEVLEAELEKAKEDAEELGVAIEHAAEAVISKEAERMANGFMSKLEEQRRDQYILAAMMNRWIPRERDNAVVGITGSPVRGVRQVRLPAIVRTAASQPILGDSELRGGILVRNAMTMAVAAYWQKLKADANAQFDAGDTSKANPVSSFVESDLALHPEDAGL